MIQTVAWSNNINYEMDLREQGCCGREGLGSGWTGLENQPAVVVAIHAETKSLINTWEMKICSDV